MHHTTEPFDPDRWDAYIDSVIENFSPAYFNRIKPMANGGHGLVFIVGMPRSGSTLLEYQLTRQFSATALGEHPTIRRLFMDLPRITGEDKTVPQCAEYITADHIDYLHKQYFMSINRLGHKTDECFVLHQSVCTRIKIYLRLIRTRARMAVVSTTNGALETGSTTLGLRCSIRTGCDSARSNILGDI